MAGGAAFTEIVTVVRDKFGLGKMVMGGDRGIITSARIQAPNQLEDGTQRQDAYGSITALRPRHQETHGRRRSAPAQPLQPAEPGRDHQPELLGYGLGDASSPTERVVFFGQLDEQGRVELSRWNVASTTPIVPRPPAGTAQPAGPVAALVACH